MGSKYKRDVNRKLEKAERFVLPHNSEDDETITATVVEFPVGSTYQTIKNELIKVLLALGHNRQQAKNYIRTAFPGVY